MTSKDLYYRLASLEGFYTIVSIFTFTVTNDGVWLAMAVFNVVAMVCFLLASISRGR